MERKKRNMIDSDSEQPEVQGVLYEQDSGQAMGALD